MAKHGSDETTLFLCGDVMTGRGIDQILPRSCPPVLHEPCVRDARRYVDLAEAVSGPISRPVEHGYVWGDALHELDRQRPDARIVNLETSITLSDRYWPKGINYRMHPDNVPVLTAAGIQCCVLANNHVLDWGRAGLDETLRTLERAGLRTVGAGNDLAAARARAVLPLPAGGGRLLVFAAATGDSGVPPEWAATGSRAGVHRLPDLSDSTLRREARRLLDASRPGDIVVYSIHWGPNWGFDIPPRQRAFARGLVDAGAVDLVHGHSSHHVKGMEVRHGRLILYGCGDLLNDYEGIGGHERYRGDLALMYFPTLERSTGRIRRLILIPTRLRRFRIRYAGGEDRDWLIRTLARECGRFGAAVEPHDDHALRLRW